jgi:hypothetical protein
MHMQRKWSSDVLVSLLFTLLLTGCSSGGGDSAAPVVPAGTAEGLWTGMITGPTGQRTVRGVVLDNGSYWFLYSAVGTPTLIAGTLQGNDSTQNGTFASSTGLDFSNELEEKLDVTVTAPYVMRQDLGGTLKYSGPVPLTFTSAFDPEYDDVPDIAPIAGTYPGSVFGFPHTIDIDLGGTITVTTTGGPHRTGSSVDVSGIELGCDFTGSLSPRSHGNVYDISLTPSNNANMCHPDTLEGVAFFDADPNPAVTTKIIYVLALNSSRTRVFPFTGTRP